MNEHIKSALRDERICITGILVSIIALSILITYGPAIIENICK